MQPVYRLRLLQEDSRGTETAKDDESQAQARTIDEGSILIPYFFSFVVLPGDDSERVVPFFFYLSGEISLRSSEKGCQSSELNHLSN